MQTVILAGGTGTRLKEMTEFIPKALIQIGGRPMIYHILRHYAHHGFTNFVIALGYKQEAFKEYFSHFDEINNDVVIHTGQRGMTCRDETLDNWKIILSDTGEKTMKGGRLKRIEKYIKGDTFFLVYGDAVSDINLRELLAFHNAHGKLVTITAVHIPSRFGEIQKDGSAVTSFTEKPDNAHFINAGFYVCNRKIFDYLTADENCELEVGVLDMIANKGEMQVFEHTGFWKAVDTLKDMGELQTIWETGGAPWKTWK